uniref:Uncharacterized protein n=1 Tax=Hyaloperonospora arabidopsidis (strain Emoy2) TaxID=559515 RepID=M4BPF9_HYAAE
MELGVPLLVKQSRWRSVSRLQPMRLWFTSARLSKFKTRQTWMEMQLDLLIWMQQPVAKLTSATQAPPNQPGTNFDSA